MRKIGPLELDVVGIGEYVVELAMRLLYPALLATLAGCAFDPSGPGATMDGGDGIDGASIDGQTDTDATFTPDAIPADAGAPDARFCDQWSPPPTHFDPCWFHPVWP